MDPGGVGQSTELGTAAGGWGLEHKLDSPSFICSFIHHSFIQQVLRTHHVASIGVRHISDPNKQSLCPCGADIGGGQAVDLTINK